MRGFMRSKEHHDGPSEAIDLGPNSASRPPEVWGGRLV